MSLGLPAHLAPQAVRRSFIRAQHTVATTLLIIAILAVLVIQGSRLVDPIWPAVVGLLPAIGMLLIRITERTALWSVLYLVLGGGGVYWYATVLLNMAHPIDESDGFSFVAVKVALLMVGGSGVGLASGLAWTTLGYLVAEGAIGVALLQAGMSLRFDWATLSAFLFTIGILPLINLITRRQIRAQPRLHRAARDEQLAAMRYRIEVKAAALMHDTVLNHLAAIADAPDGGLAVDLQAQIRRDVEFLVSEEWLAEPAVSENSRARLDWQSSGLFTAIQESRLLGLEVETTGDLPAVGRLNRERSTALGLAVKQCLVNVLKHSGTTRAEVAVYGSGSELSVIVVDSGRGFIEGSTGSDRLGLRTSVRKRIEAVNGAVNVWSTPGRGTSVMIRVPMSGLGGAVSGEEVSP